MNILSNKKNNNVFTTFLSYLGVRYTDEYANKLYNEHPHKYNLFGLSKMLSDYNIKNTGVKITNKEEAIRELETPFIAHIGTDFVVVTKITPGKIEYVWNRKNWTISLEEFFKMWSGIILYAEPDEKSIESGYRAQRRKEIFGLLQKATLFVAALLVLVIAFVKNELYNNIEYYLLAIANMFGIYVGYLLVLKQMHIHSKYADKICSLFSQSECNDVLESDAAKLWGMIGWSEIGLGYFTTNMLIAVCFPSLIIYMALINVLALPYTLWSVWYQKYKAKQWCPLCLIVQALLWIVFLINMGFGLIGIREMNMVDILLTGSLYLIPILLINKLTPMLSQSGKMEQITQELNSIKADENVFLAMLKKQPRYEVAKETSSILWGNKDADILITVFTNPHCNPCAKMHKRVEQILSETNNLCIQYIFSSFHKDLDSSNKFLSAIYLNKEESEKKTIFRNWFDGGKNKKEEFFEIHRVDTESAVTLNEFEKHQAWKDKTGLRATPTTLVNGYKLPDNYKIEDMKYFTELDL